MLRGTEKVRVELYDEHDYKGRSELAHIDTKTVWGRFDTVSTQDVAALYTAGLTGARTAKKFFCVSFPGDHRSIVIDRDGRRYRVAGEPEVRRRGSRTRHTVVTLVQETPEVVYG